MGPSSGPHVPGAIFCCSLTDALELKKKKKSLLTREGPFCPGISRRTLRLVAPRADNPHRARDAGSRQPAVRTAFPVQAEFFPPSSVVVRRFLLPFWERSPLFHRPPRKGRAMLTGHNRAFGNGYCVVMSLPGFFTASVFHVMHPGAIVAGRSPVKVSPITKHSPKPCSLSGWMLFYSIKAPHFT